MTSAEDELPPWGILPNAAVALVLFAAGLTDRTTGWPSVACVAVGSLYALDVGRCLRRPIRPRGRRLGSLLILGLLRPLILPPARAAMWVVVRLYLYDFKRNHRSLVQPGERLLLVLRERGGDGDSWVLSNQAIYIGRNDRRLPRIPREDVKAVSVSTLGAVRVVTLSVMSQSQALQDMTGCFSEYAYRRPLRRLVTELGPDDYR